jgi:hypothetical protein
MWIAETDESDCRLVLTAHYTFDEPRCRRRHCPQDRDACVVASAVGWLPVLQPANIFLSWPGMPLPVKKRRRRD